MEHVVHAVFLATVYLGQAGATNGSTAVCNNGGNMVVQGFTTIVNVGKYLLGLAVFLGAAIWLITEFFREAQTGAFKVSSFIFAHQVPLLLLLLGVGLLMGFAATSLGAPQGAASCAQ